MEGCPFFSVIVTTFNRRNFLERSINSLLGQTEQDWEAIIVDDGSNDLTYEYCIELCRTYPRISYFYHQNQGTPFARQIGLNIATGLYITFLDSDDEYKPEHLQFRKRILVENPLIDFLYGGYLVVGSKLVPDLRNPQKMISLDQCVIGGTFFIRRASINRIGGIPKIQYGDDAKLYEIAKAKGLVVRKVNFPTYIYHREHNESKTKEYTQDISIYE
ncbi:MAG: glycosyltransferase family 2 protein [Candidatus Kapaibacteriales bacterium]